jgi:hypothetical protein
MVFNVLVVVSLWGSDQLLCFRDISTECRFLTNSSFKMERWALTKADFEEIIWRRRRNALGLRDVQTSDGGVLKEDWPPCYHNGVAS